MLYDTTLLRTFVAICDAGSFTKAARAVNLSQSAVSHHVKRLEDQVGVDLIVRNTRGLRLTEKGDILLCYARRILALYKEADQSLSRDGGGQVRIGALEFFDMRLLSSLLAQFSDRHPAVQTHVELGVAPYISALLDKGELDLGITFGELGEGEGVPLSREPRVWAGAQAMRLAPDEPAPLAVYPPFCPWRQVALNELDRVGRASTIKIQGTDTSAILSAVEAGLAITIFAASALPPPLKALGAAEGLPELPDFEFVLKRSRTASPAADHLSEMIVNFYQLSTALKPESAANDGLRSQRPRVDS
jgi:DNA-binding transcriptional LysR family regulator